MAVSSGRAPVGQAIRRFRDLGMPLDQVKQVLDAPDADSRNEVIAAHLRQMEQALAQTRETVASLRALREVNDPLARLDSASDFAESLA